MKYHVKHYIKGRIRLSLNLPPLDERQADTIKYYMLKSDGIISVKVYQRTASIAIEYSGNTKNILKIVEEFNLNNVEVPDRMIENTGTALDNKYKEKLLTLVAVRFIMKSIMPPVVGMAYGIIRSIKYIKEAAKSLSKAKLDVNVLDATAITVSMARGDFATAGSIMFLLTVGEILEEWTHKKTIGDLARTMSLNIGQVWKQDGDARVLVDGSGIKVSDNIVVQMGNVVPFDGNIVEGEAMMNLVSLTGESKPVYKSVDSYVYAGTVVEEGEIVVEVKELSGTTRYDRIIKLIEESEKLKSNVENRAEVLANNLVPYTFMGTGLVYLLTGNAMKALSVLLVDFSCALKLAMPITVLSAMREARENNINVKGGKYLESMAEADIIVFDKTGTLTKATPEVVDIINFGPGDLTEKIRVAACLEEHFPHSMARAVVEEAARREIYHDEMHSKVEYIVAHGVVSYVDGKKVMIGSEHFIFNDEKCSVHEEYQKAFDELPEEYSHLFFAVKDKLEAVILIEDPLRDEAVDMMRDLKELGIKKTVMMTGDNKRIASSIAKKVGIDKYYSEVLPENKAEYVEAQKENGSIIAMIGDGVNDAPALAASDVGIAMSRGAELAREISDVNILKDDLSLLPKYRELSMGMMKRIDYNYKSIIGINMFLILLGVGGLIQPMTSAIIHNASTLGIGLYSTKNILKDR
ncbi:MAG: heavy metal translocating P-type ATPase [Tissierellia bacterium]|nr:heavy metal translocating P-type ATPase [Tissierellia bacterium]